MSRRRPAPEPQPEDTPYQPPRHQAQDSSVITEEATPERCAADYTAAAATRAAMDRHHRR